MSATLKIGKLPDTTPIKITVALEPELQSDLQTYAEIYQQTYGDKASIAALIPVMLRSFMTSDAGFRRARKSFNTPPTKTQ